MKAAIFALITAVSASSAVAGDTLTRSDQNGTSGWTYTVAPYGFLAGMKGDVAAFGVPPVSVDLSTGDVLEKLDFSLAGVFEARNGKFAVGTDLFYASISAGKPTRFGVIADELTVSSDVTFVTAYGAYELARTDKGFIDAVGGLRYWSVDNKFTISGLPVVGTRNVSDDASWVDGIVGVKGQAVLSDRLYFAGWAYVGTNSMYDVQASVGYRFTDTTSFTVGWRETAVDYSDGDFMFDVALSGPLLGLVFNF